MVLDITLFKQADEILSDSVSEGISDSNRSDFKPCNKKIKMGFL